MKKMFVTAPAVGSIAGVPIVEPFVGSANSTGLVQQAVSRQYGTTIRNRARLSGMHVLNTSVRGAGDGGGQFSCYAAYTASRGRVTGKYSVYIDVTRNGGWHTVGRPYPIGMH